MVLNNVISALKAEFPNLKVYTDTIAQGVVAPCFIVKSVSLKWEVLTTTRRLEQHTYSVTYLSPDREDDTDALGMRVRLCQVLQFIGIAHCTDLDCNVEDGVLSVVCKYNVHVFEQGEPEETMDTFEREEN